MEVRGDDRGVDACYSGTQKSLSIPFGGLPITFGERAMRKVRNRKQKPYSYYFDIQELMLYWSGAMEKSYHHTAAIPLAYATPMRRYEFAWRKGWRMHLSATSSAPSCCSRGSNRWTSSRLLNLSTGCP
jgi:hypothetical protein